MRTAFHKIWAKSLALSVSSSICWKSWGKCGMTSIDDIFGGNSFRGYEWFQILESLSGRCKFWGIAGMLLASISRSFYPVTIVSCRMNLKKLQHVILVISTWQVCSPHVLFNFHLYVSPETHIIQSGKGTPTCSHFIFLLLQTVVMLYFRALNGNDPLLQHSP